MWAPVLARLEGARKDNGPARKELMQRKDSEYRPGPFVPADLSQPASPSLNRWAYHVLRRECKLPVVHPGDPKVIAPLSEPAYLEYRRLKKEGKPWKGTEGDDEEGLSDALSLEDSWESDARPLPSGTRWRLAGWEERRPPTPELPVGSDHDAAGETDDEMEVDQPSVPVPPSPPPVAPSPPPPAVEHPPPPPLAPALPLAPSMAQYVVMPPVAPPPPGRIEAPELPYRRLASVPIWMAGNEPPRAQPWQEPHRS